MLDNINSCIVEPDDKNPDNIVSSNDINFILFYKNGSDFCNKMEYNPYQFRKEKISIEN